MLTCNQQDVSAKTKTIGFVAYPGMDPIDLCGPLDALTGVDRMSRLFGQTDALPAIACKCARHGYGRHVTAHMYIVGEQTTNIIRRNR